MHILSVNAGSSSIKACVYEFTGSIPEISPSPLWEAHVQWKEEYRDAKLTYQTHLSPAIQHPLEITSLGNALTSTLKTLWNGDNPLFRSSSDIDIVGHRVVHGGSVFCKTTHITQEMKETLEELSYLAPLHNPANLEGIKTAEHLFPGSHQFAVFDTAFHTTLPLEAKIYPGPYAWFENEIYRYGFHGISHQYCAARCADLLQKPLDALKICICHLGAGGSLCAVKGGKSIDTTMGFTPLEGVMMGSRSGSVDPGILLFLAKEKNLSFEKIDHMLNKESGLLGISGISEDVRDILAAKDKGDKKAKLALDIYLHRLLASIGAMTTSLEGLDALVFTAGIGENAAWIREKACKHLAFLGADLDPQRNNTQAKEDVVISSPASKVSLLVIHTQEEWEIAKECRKSARTNMDTKSN